MTHELQESLAERADRGEHRGADAVLTRARIDLERTGERSARRPAWIVAFGAAAIAAVVLGGGAMFFAMLSGPADGSSPTSAPMAATTEATTTTIAQEPTTTVIDTTVPPIMNPPTVQDPIEWYRISLASNGSIASVAANDERAVAIGRAYDELAVWVSAGGTEWDRIPYDEAVFGAGDWSELQDIVAGPDGFVIIGSTRFDTERFPTAWRSPDGLTWERIDLDPVELGLRGPVNLMAVTYGPHGYVAVGWTTRENETWRLNHHVVLRSDDGRTWEPAEDLNDLPLGGMWDVTAGGPGYVAVGVDWSDLGVGRAGVWLSDDAIHWSLVDRDAIECVLCDDIEQMNIVATDGERLIATGVGANVWASVDGTRWEIIGKHHPPTDPGHGVYAQGVIVAGDRIVAVGSLEYNAGPEPDGSAAWTSEDGGLTWTASMLPESVFGGLPGEMAMHSLVRFGDPYIAVGDWNGSATVWVGQWNEEDGS